MSSSSFSKVTRTNSSGSYNTVNKKLKKIDLGMTPTNETDNAFSNFDHDYTGRVLSNEDEEDEEEEDEDQAEELPMLDQIDSVKPVVDHQDRLWKQIDILDDVKKMSSDIMNNGTFFNLQHSDLLKNLKESQLKLLFNMKKLEKMIDESIYHEIWDLNVDDSLDDEIEMIKVGLFEKDQFTRINSSINEIKDGLDDLKRNIKIVDESTKDMWDNNDFSIVD